MSAFEWDTEGFYRSINFYKKEENWQEILEVAANNVADEIRDDAENILYSQVNKVTGSIGESIESSVEVEDGSVTLSIGSNHPAAAMIEYGGFVPDDRPGVFTNVDKYAREAGQSIHAFTAAIKANQPFMYEQPFLRPALIEGKDAIESEIHAVAKEMTS